MAQKSSNTTGSTPSAATEDAVSNLMTLQSDMYQRMSAIYSEWAQFMAHRIQEDMKTQQKLWSCRNPQDVREVQEEFFARAREEYADEMEKLTTMTQEMMTRLAERR